MGIKTSVFYIDLTADLELVWQNLEEAGCNLLYSDASENSQQIFGSLPLHLKKNQLIIQYPEILAIESFELPDIDWESQWAAHEAYHEGFLHVDLKKYATETTFSEWPAILKMIPGPGFGDLSHPTTRLVLKLMPAHILNKSVIDVGCGSGILSIAAVAMGASSVTGIDIDEEALIHSRSNSACNGMSDCIIFTLPEMYKNISNDSVVLMNMIQSEQLVAWQSLEPTAYSVSIAITSGILSEARADYLTQTAKWGWQLISEQEEDGWLGFIFNTSHSK